MFGFAVYAAVCAELKEPLRFPGDYLAWDKEFCESSAVMNSYLSEWAVCMCLWGLHVCWVGWSADCLFFVFGSDGSLRERSVQRPRRPGIHLVPLLALPRPVLLPIPCTPLHTPAAATSQLTPLPLLAGSAQPGNPPPPTPQPTRAMNPAGATARVATGPEARHPSRSRCGSGVSGKTSWRRGGC